MESRYGIQPSASGTSADTYYTVRNVHVEEIKMLMAMLSKQPITPPTKIHQGRSVKLRPECGCG
jgi:hypothetical protein